MVEHVLGCSKVEALEFILGKKVGVGAQDGQQPPAPTPIRPAREEAENKSNATTTAQAMALWEQGVDPRGTLVERYLNDDRKLDLGADLAGDVLRWHRWHQGVGAMLALFRNILTGEPQAISRTFIDPNTLKRTLAKVHRPCRWRGGDARCVRGRARRSSHRRGHRDVHVRSRIRAEASMGARLKQPDPELSRFSAASNA